MDYKKRIFIIIGSASEESSGERIVKEFIDLTDKVFTTIVFNELSTIPHFNPKLTFDNSPETVKNFRDQVAQADGVVICTPEYIFSVPSRLKNVLEWCVSTTVFLNKPIGIITASADGQQGHKELQLIMKTLMASFKEENTLLIQAVKGKINEKGEIADEKTQHDLVTFIQAFETLVNS